jgi:hypothetical protein
VRDEFHLMMKDIKQNKFDRMDANHHLLAGFKALFSEDMVRMVDESRRACGGAGFASNSGFTDCF